jgi:integrase
MSLRGYQPHARHSSSSFDELLSHPCSEVGKDSNPSGCGLLEFAKPGARAMTVRRSKTVAGERLIPLTSVALSALARLRARAESFGPVAPSHYVFAAFVPKFTFSGKKVMNYAVTEFDPTTHIKSWRTAWRTLTKKAGLPGFRFHDLRHCAIAQLAESGAADSTIMAIAGHVSRRMLERYSHVRMEAKRSAMETLAASTRTAGYDTNVEGPKVLDPSKLLI